MGLTHPNGFVVAIVFIFIFYGINFKMKFLQKEVILHLTTSLCIGGIVASFYYIPLIYNLIYYRGLDTDTYVTEVWPTSFFWLYGPLPFLGLCIFFNKGKDIKSWMLSSLLLIIALVLIRFFTGLIIDVNIASNLWIDRYGPYMFIFLALLATAGLDNLSRLMNNMRYVVIVIMFLTILIGYATNIKYLNAEFRPSIVIDYFAGLNKKEIMRTFYKRETIGTFIGNVFPESGIEKIRFQVPNPQDTLIVPPSPPYMSYVVASESGLHVSYVKDHRVFYKDFFDKTISQEERFKMTDVFYKDLEKGIFRKDVLSFFKTEIFLAPYDELEKKHIQLDKITSIEFNNKKYFLYKLIN